MQLPWSMELVVTKYMPGIAAITSLIFSLLFVPFVRWLSFRLGKVAQPRKDRWHRKPTPTLGGVGMFLAFTAAILVMTAVQGDWSTVRWPILAAALIMFLLGFVDDLLRLTPPTKLIVQIIAAAVVIFFGRVIDFFPWGFANVIFTFFWLVGITNAINLLDNMDGLAGGISLIAAGFLTYFFWRAGDMVQVVLCAALAGSILGFLIFNFPPAKIFMGDSGSMFLGFTLAALAVAHRPRASDVFTVLGVPTLLFLLPILDTTLVTITRLMRGQSPAQGGTDHTSHRLIAFGLTERQAVLAMYAVGILSGAAGAVLEALDYDLSLVLIPVLIIGLSLLTAYLGRMKVVSSVTASPGTITRFMVQLTYKRRLLEILLDFFLIGVSYYLAFWTWNGFLMSEASMELFLNSLPAVLAVTYLSFSVAGVYRGVWKYVGLDDLIPFVRAVLAAVLLTAAPLLIFFNGQYALVVFFLYGVFLFLGLTGSRISFPILDRLYGRQHIRGESVAVLIYGAADSGVIALRWLLSNPDLGYRPVGFLDDDSLMWGRRIYGLTVIGGCEQAGQIIDEKSAGGIIIASPELLKNGPSDVLLEVCRKKGVWVRLLRMDFELLE